MLTAYFCWLPKNRDYKQTVAGVFYCNFHTRISINKTWSWLGPLKSAADVYCNIHTKRQISIVFLKSCLNALGQHGSIDTSSISSVRTHWATIWDLMLANNETRLQLMHAHRLFVELPKKSDYKQTVATVLYCNFHTRISINKTWSWLGALKSAADVYCNIHTKQ